MFYEVVENVKDISAFELKALKFCPNAQFNWDPLWQRMPCYEVLWEDDVPRWTVESREVE